MFSYTGISGYFYVFITITDFIYSYKVMGSHSNATSLYDMISSRRYVYVRPVIDQSKPIQINMALYLSKLRKFDEISGELGLTAYFEIRWVDETLFWDPEDYANITDLLLPHGTIWKPSFVSGNPYDDFSVIHNDETLIRLQYNGSVTWKPADTFGISCEADVSQYPFDEQTCYFPIVPWNYLPRELSILPLADHVNMDRYVPHNVWEIKDTAVWKPYVEKQEVLVFKFNLKRNSGFYLLNLIFPICVLGIMNLFVFLLPPESGERVGYSITVLLSIVVFLTITSNSLPGTSEPRMPTIFLLLTGYVVISVLIVISVIIGLRFYLRDQELPVSAYWKSLILFYRIILDRRIRRKINIEENLQKEIINHTENGQDYDKETVTWKTVGETADVIFCFMFLLMIIVVNTLYFVDVYGHSVF